jgi:O-antigen/teichoic acid export membrane protein
MNPSLVWIGALQVLMTLVGLGRAKVLANLLSPAGFGVVSTIDQLIMTIVQLGALGLPFAALKFMAQAHSESAEKFQRVAGQFARAVCGLGVVATGLFFAVLHLRPGWVGPNLLPYRGYLVIAGLSITTTMLAIVAANTFAAAQRSIAAAGFNLCMAIALALGAIFGFGVGGLNGLYAGTAISGWMGTLAAAVLLRHSLGVQWLPLGHNGPAAIGARALLATSTSVYLTLASSAVCMFAISYAVFSRLGDVQAGLFQSSMSIALTVGAVLAPITNVYLIPILNRVSNPVQKRVAAEKFVSGLMFLLMLGALPIICFPRLFLELLYSSKFTTSADILFAFILWQCVVQLTYVYQQLLIGLNDMVWMSILAMLGFGASAVLAVLLVPSLGLIGAPLGLALGMLIYAVAIAARLRWAHQITVSIQVVLRAAWTLAAVTSGGLLFGHGEELSASSLGERVGFAVICLALTWLLFLRDEFARAPVFERLFNRKRP